MFTGIVQATGRIQTLIPNSFGLRLTIDAQGWKPAGITLAAGDSVCVSGVCLTLLDPRTHPPKFSFDVIQETLARTKLGRLKVGDQVNLEPCLTAQSQLGGHFVQGHVDGLGTVEAIKADASEWRTTIRPPAELLDYIVPKGSIAVDGVSLTIASVSRQAFEIALIPTTLNLTTLAQLKTGDPVNLETDIIARSVVHVLRRQAEGPGGVTLESLRRAGFLA